MFLEVKMKLKLLSIFFLISVVPLFAQENVFTLEKAIIRAMDQNRDIKIARLEKDRAKEKYKTRESKGFTK